MTYLWVTLSLSMNTTTHQSITQKDHVEGVVLTLQNTGAILAILISTSVLLGVAIKLVSVFNEIISSLRDLREDLNAHTSSEGHTKMLEQVLLLKTNLIEQDKRYAVHLQDYVNYKEANLLAFNVVREAVADKWQRTETELHIVKGSIKNLESFLQKKDDFKIRK